MPSAALCRFALAVSFGPLPFDTFDTFAFDFDTFAFDTVSFDFDTVSFAFDTVSFDFGTFFSDPFSFDSFAGALALGVDRPEDNDLVVACDLDPGARSGVAERGRGLSLREGSCWPWTAAAFSHG